MGVSLNRRRHKPSRPRTIVNEAVLDPAQEQIWRMANDDLSAAVLDRRARAHRLLQRLEGQLAANLEVEQVQRGIAETTALARARGEQTEISKRVESRGRVRIRSRDGLETMQRGGAITALQFRAGLLYRDLYEATDPERDLRSQMASPALSGGGSGGIGGVSEAWAERRLRLTGSMARLEDKVRSVDRNGRAVRALREVAGHARCISHFVAGGGSQAAYRRALVVALDVCAGHFKLV